MRRGAILLSFLLILFVNSFVEEVEAQSVSDDLYIIQPIGTKALEDNLVLDVSESNGKLIMYKEHGLGNQVFGVEWRPEANGYIIYMGSDKQSVLKVDGSFVTTEKIDKSVNNLYRFSDNFIWKITANAGNYTIQHKASGQFLTVQKKEQSSELKLQAADQTENQKFEFKMFNGYYFIASNAFTDDYVFDISRGVDPDKEILAYKKHGGTNQQWYILYEPEINGYVIGNAQDKSLLIAKNQAGGLVSKRYDSSVLLEKEFRNVIIPKKSSNPATKDTQIYRISSEYYQSNYITAVEKEDPLSYSSPFNGAFSEWRLTQTKGLPYPKMTTVKLTKPKASYFVGEEIDLQTTLTSTEFNASDVFYRWDALKYEQISKGIAFSNGQLTKDFKVATKNLKEGKHHIETMGKAEGLFRTNSMAVEVNLLYPTPSGTPVSKKVPWKKQLSALNPRDFVKDVKDEVGNTIDVKIKSLDTSKIGQTTAIITLENQYKKVDVSVPVEIYADDPISATGVSQTIVLGTDIASLNFYNFVKEVKSGTYSLPAQEYTVKPINVVSDVAGVQQAKVEVASKQNPANKVEVQVAVTVPWGSSIEVDLVLYPGHSSYALNLQTGGSTPKLYAFYGNNTNTARRLNWLNDYAQTIEYIKTKVYTPTAAATHVQTATPVYEYGANGKSNLEYSVKNFGTNGVQEVRYGDVVSQYVLTQDPLNKYPDNNRLYVNEVLTKQNKGLSTVYYEVTTNGFKPLRFNQLEVKEQSIYKNTTNQQLETNVKNYLSTGGHQNLVVKKFVTYPDTSIEGQTTGVVQVEETLTTGKKITYDYTIPFAVSKETEKPKGKAKLLILDINDADKILGASDYKKFLKEYSDNWSANDKLVATLMTSDTEVRQKVSQVQATSFTVKLADEAGNYVLIEIPTFVKDNQTVVAKDEKIAMRAENISMKAEDYPKTDTERESFIKTQSKLKAWALYDDKVGEQLDNKDSKFSTNNLPGSGTLPKEGSHSLVFTYDKNQLKLTKPIQLTIIGSLKFVKVPKEIIFNDVEATASLQYAKRKEVNTQISIQNTLDSDWVLKAKATDLKNGEGNIIKNGVVYIDNSGKEKALNSTSNEIVKGAKVETSPTVSWTENKGVLLKIPAEVYTGDYTSEITWILETTP